MYRSLFDRTLMQVQHWSPRSEYPREPGYSDDLWKFLTSRIRDAEITRDDKNDKKGLDIGIRQRTMYGNHSVGIELKRNMKKTEEQNRLIGQLDTKGRQYGGIIIVLVGESSNNMVVKTREWIRGKTDPITGIVEKPYQIVIKGPLN